MNEAEVAATVVEWVGATLEEIQTSYDYPVASKLGALPDAAAHVERKRIVPSDEAFPFSALEQVWLRVFEVELSIMVEVDADDAATPEALETASRAGHQALMDFGDRLERALWADATLGGRLAAAAPNVAMASPRVVFDYSLPFVRYEDGTRGRFMRVEMAVGETVAAPD